MPDAWDDDWIQGANVRFFSTVQVKLILKRCIGRKGRAQASNLDEEANEGGEASSASRIQSPAVGRSVCIDTWRRPSFADE